MSTETILGTARLRRSPPRTRAALRGEALLILAAWTLVGALFGSTSYLRAELYGEPISMSHAAALAALDVYSWAVITFAAFWATRRFPVDAERWVRNIAVLSALGLALVVARAFGLHWFFQASGWFPVRTVAQALYSYVPPNFVSFGLILGLAHAVEFARRYRERQLSAAQLEAQLARTQLQMLKMQLHPHFLFNTLHAISTLVHRDADAAERMIASLSELLRSTLTHQQRQEVTVAEEMDLLEPYLDIEKTRLGGRLALRIRVDPSAREAHVPHLILQPLVENAIRHGIAPLRRGGAIAITVARDGERLEIEVADDGQGFARTTRPDRPGPGGVGLSNTRARLRQLYGTEHRFSLVSTPGQGTRVEIVIPFRTADAAAELIPA